VADDRDESAAAGDRTWVQGAAGSSSRSDETIGNYRVLRTLGEGGMGLVYEAEQLRPVRRRVALKLIRTGLDTDDVRLRFESERQALALMDHPAIARVFDAGVTAEGRPFFAMELVAGVPITELCDRERLDLGERLRLFRLVCDGVQHAHQKGIIHRDIKPSNILVAGTGAERSVKIIDFGVAKATTERLTDRTFLTEMGALVGTPQYMSPEQADMRGLDIDTRTDVYLLGTLLHELLTGCLPFDPRMLQERGLTEYRRQVVEVDPYRPSERFARLEPAEAREAAERRSTDPQALARTLRGDLDAITLKALEKDRAQRYASASELAADVGRYLRNEPVTATPPSGFYQLRKFARRHRVGVGFASVLVVLLAAFGVSMAVYASALAHARDLAESQKQAATQAADYLVEMFESSDPEKALGAQVTARDVLNRGRDRIKELEGQPLLQARMLHTMGGVYTSAGLYEEARPLLEEALRIRRSWPDVPPIDVADTESSLAGLLVHLGQYDRVRELYQEALDIRTAELGPTDPEVARSLTSLANTLGVMGRDEEAAALHDRALQIRLRGSKPDDPEIALSQANQALHLERAGKYAEARSLYEQALATWRKKLEPNDPMIARALERLGCVAEAEGDLPTAVRYHEQALMLRRSIYGNDPHSDVAKSLLSLATLRARQGDLARGATLHDEALAIFDRAHQLDQPIVRYQEAGYLATIGRTTEAIEHLRLAVVDGHYANANELLRDVRFRPLANDPAFQSIVAAARR
jgi:non-specific serine/threonine protein kinase/serine/threonine-protein kinase